MAKGGSKKRATGDLRESAHRIWLAGLGALAAAEEEGSKLFKNLVERGEAFEGRGRDRVDEVRRKAKSARQKAGGKWSKLEEGLDERISAALGRFGVPTSHEIEKLMDRVDALSAMLEAKVEKAGAPRKRTAKKAPRKKAAVRKKPAKSTKKATKKPTRKTGKKRAS